MIPVVLCGSDKDSEMISVLLTAIHATHTSALHITPKTISLFPQDTEDVRLLLVENSGIRDLHMEKGIILFSKGIPSGAEYTVPTNFVAILEPDNDRAVEIIQKNALRTVTCGLSLRDTFTFSSLESDHAVISLQRGLAALDGSSILPVEIPVAISAPHSEYCLLASVAVLMLSSIPLKEEGIRF